jgi:16S rRNA (uracil1498-N3)-methyltransferase
MLPRFYAPELDPSAPLVTLSADEARHLTRVLRLAAGDSVSVFDGRGVEFEGTVDSCARERVTVRLLRSLAVPASPAVSLIVAQAVLKGSSMDDAVRDATMMGAESIEPVLTAHGDVKTSLVMRDATVERWRRIALAATKQSRRATLPAVHAARPLREWLAHRPSELVLMFVEPSAACVPKPLRDLLDHRVPARGAVLLGPEGGWAPEELEAALAAGCLPVTLGPLTLRAESMPVAALAALQAIWPR